MEQALFTLIRGLLTPLTLIPLRWGRFAGRLMGGAAYHLVPPLRRKVLATIHEGWGGMLSLNPAMGRVSPATIARRFFQHLGVFVVEVLRIDRGSDRFLDEVEFRGVEHFQQAKERGRGILFITAHCGNWEASALAFARRFEPFAVVVRHQRSAAVTHFLDRLRNRYGNETIMKRGAAKRILTLVRQGRMVGILSDIAVEEKDGILTPFLGNPAWTTGMPATMALRTGCALLPCFIHREGERLVVTFHPEIPTEGRDERSITADISSVIERHIALHPEEWFWFYHRWRRAPGGMDGQ
ncbi:MAG: lysophospholipid acyltransferase family protein [Desulfuromonadia bacterium]